ncbi:expressed unknown protein [Seminavis robusta]|uniref:Uncharacterized protein n=1 Tax=Seminavis robusta TaxID=568900 RepID=A0A9N8EMK9_9STRA|nr:expressed unknown protein [Seminavis robusta]|eukprot:Sro1341_g264440.1 n/a (287) ;mRNA; f:4945-5805
MEKKKKQYRPRCRELNDAAVTQGMHQHLTALASKKDGGIVAIVTLLGTFSPVTVSHIDAFVQARNFLTNDSMPSEIHRPEDLEDLDLVLGFASVNAQSYVDRKFARLGAAPPLPYEDRRYLVELAIQQQKLEWMGLEDWEGCSVAYLRKQYPNLTFIHFVMNGADDVLKYQKWNYMTDEENRFITMGRPGMTGRLLEELQKAKEWVNLSQFLVGPELQEVSSTQARSALETIQSTSADTTSKKEASEELDALLDRAVKQWCITEGPWAPQDKDESKQKMLKLKQKP